MNTKNIALNILFFTLVLSAFMQMALAGALYAAADDRDDALDRLVQDQIFTYGSGQRVQDAINEKGETAAHGNVDMHTMVEDRREDAAAPQGTKDLQLLLKGPRGGGMPVAAGPAKTEVQAPNLIDITQYNVDVGDGSTRVIGGVTHRFVGFGVGGYGAAQLQDALNDASVGDVVIVRGGVYGGTRQAGADSFVVHNGVKLLGGYREDGTRDISGAASVIKGYFVADNITEHTEINGFTLTNYYYGIKTANSSDQLEIRNNTFAGVGYIHINADSSGAVVDNNIFSGAGQMIYSNASSLTVTNNIFQGINNFNQIIYENDSASTIRNNFFTSSNDTYNSVPFIEAYHSASIIENNTFYDPIGINSYVIWADSPCTVRDNLIQSEFVNMPVEGPSEPMGKNGEPPSPGRTVPESWVTYVNNLGIISMFDNTFIGSSDIDPASGRYEASGLAAGYSHATIQPAYITVMPDPVSSQTLAPAAGGYAEDTLFRNVSRDVLEDLIASPAGASYAEAMRPLSAVAGEALSESQLSYDGGPAVPAKYTGLAESARDFVDTYAYLWSLSYIRDAAEAEAVTKIDGIVTELEAKKDRTDMESAILDVAQAVMQESAYIDETTMQEFAQAIQYIRLAESMKEIMPGVDLDFITNTLTALAEEQRELYGDYIAATEDMYRRIEAAVGIDITKEVLPDEYVRIRGMSELARKRLLLSKAIDRLRAKDGASLTDGEREAIRLFDEKLRPLTDAYRSRLRGAVMIFIAGVRQAFKDRPPVALESNKDTLNAVLMIDKDDKYTR